MNEIFLFHHFRSQSTEMLWFIWMFSDIITMDNRKQTSQLLSTKPIENSGNLLALHQIQAKISSRTGFEQTK